mgnify:CR=1 FL=1
MQYFYAKGNITKSNFTMIVVYANNPNREYLYYKQFSSSVYAKQWVINRRKNEKVLFCDYKKGRINYDHDKPIILNENKLTALDKPNYFRDKEGYKYYIKDNIKIKSDKPVFKN